MAEDQAGPLGRRNFFRDAAARVVGPLADYIEKRVEIPVRQTRLRPPGAIEESLLLSTCLRCGMCEKACPANAISAISDDEGDAAGTPIIDPDKTACVVCEGLQCTHVCPSGALVPLTDPSQIRMGVAEVYGALCKRTDGGDCILCVDQCPVGEVAIRFPGSGPPEVLSPGCVGCGVCQQVCPTSPKAITVSPL